MKTTQLLKATPRLFAILTLALLTKPAGATPIGPGADITNASAQDTPGGERLNLDTTAFATLAAGTYFLDNWALNVFDHTQGGTVTPMLVSGFPASYTTLWVGSAFDPVEDGIQSVPESGSFTLTAETEVYAGFFSADLGSGIMALDVDNSGTGNSLTDHDNSPLNPTEAGQSVTDFSHAGLGRTYAFEVNLATGLILIVESLGFASTVAESDLISDLAGSFAGAEEPTTFELVVGEGDEHNALFNVVGQQLRAGKHNFGAETDGTQFSIRLRGTGSVSAKTAEETFIFTLSTDSDSDNLADAWELAHANNLAELSGLGGANFDSDSLTDLEEYVISTTTYPGINPKLADTDADTLEDGSEIAGAGDRPPTDPTNADTDGDMLGDAVESNTGVFKDASDTGSNPTEEDSDGDNSADGVEVAAGSNPNDAASIPPLPPGFSLSGPLSDIASSGIGPENVYTHAVSGGSAQTVNGISFDLLDPTATPADFDWNPNGFTKSQVVGNAGKWQAPPALDLELEALFLDFTYSGSGPDPESMQTFTLGGLTPGTAYDLRLYIRVWDTEGSSRPVSLTFTNGGETASPNPLDGSPEDRPSQVLGGGDDHQVYYLSYLYTAAGTELVIDAMVPATAPANSGSFHLYALTNQVAAASTPIKLTVVQSGSDLVFEWESKPAMLYNLMSSADLVAWTLVEGAIPATADMNTKTITRPGSPTLFYRVEEYPKPPVTIYSENFDGSPDFPAGWTTGPNVGDSGSTQWQLGNPAGSPGPSAANSASNCVATNLSAKYGITSDVWLRSPGTIDLTGATTAKVLFQQWVDMDDFDLGDTGTLRVLDAAGLPGTVTELAVVKTNIQGLAPTGWVQFSANLPATALGKTVALEFRFASDSVAVGDASGWYIDDVSVTAQTP